MDTINQTAQTKPVLSTIQSPTDSEFAQKGPLITPKGKQKILLGCGVTGFLIMAVIAAIYVYIEISKPPELVTEPPKPTPVSPEPVISDIPKFAYIKNDKNVWVSNINGEEKSSVVELPITSTSSIVSVAWKDKSKLGYTTCSAGITNCEILVYDFETKSVKPELTSSGSSILKFRWSPDQKYLAYIENVGGQTRLRLKLGTVDTILKSFGTEEDPSLTKTSVQFAKNGQYILFSSLRNDLTQEEIRRGVAKQGKIYPSVYIYQLNGAQIDEIPNAQYPFFIDDNTVAYVRNNELIYKVVGTTDESVITPFSGYNPAISSNEKQIAYWRDEVGFNNVVLGVYESETGVHRNILRGVIIPVWISADKIAGIKADSCLGERCLLYEFKTNSLVIVDVNNGEVISVDQGKNLSQIDFYAY